MEALAEEDVQVVIAVPRLLLMLRNGMEERLARRGLGRAFQCLLSLSDHLPVPLRKALFHPVRRRFGSNFRLFVSGGAPLSVDLFHFWNRLGFTLVEGYGLTECSPVLAANTLQSQVAGSVGVALPGVELCLRDGELLARGGNVFAGYYGNPAATAEVFTDDGWFRTGDLAELGSNGLLRIKGRCRDMIVTGAGVNVYPDEIEELLQLQTGVRDACVVGLDRGSGDEVHAVLLLLPGADAAGIVAEVNARLDDLHRITAHTVWPGEDFPRTTTMKIRKFMVREALQTGRTEAVSPTADRLLAVVARITGTSEQSLSDDTLLVADAGLTSIGRLELVTALEEEFRLDLDEASIGPETRIGDLRAQIRARTGARSWFPFRLWAAAPAMACLRRLWNALLHAPLVGLFAEIETEGCENLAGVAGPVLFVANHQSYLDQPCIQQSLPEPFTWRTATAAWAEFFFPLDASLPMRMWKRLCFEYCTLSVNMFLLPQSSGFRDSLKHMGKLADRGISILVFPEGERSWDGRLLPFRPGLAVMVEELGLPMVPLAIVGVERVLPRGARFPRRGKVVVRIGPVLRLQGKGRDEIMRLSREAVDGLLGEKGQR
jgi:long-chain acyl-CoA synthetase